MAGIESCCLSVAQGGIVASGFLFGSETFDAHPNERVIPVDCGGDLSDELVGAVESSDVG